jgi:hypothetical protein
MDHAGTSLRDCHARLSHGSVNGSPSTAAAETKTWNCRLGRGASAWARHCRAGRRSCAGHQLVRGLASRMARPTNRRSLTHQSSRPGERRQQLAPFDPQDRIVNDAFSSIGICDCVQHRCLEGWSRARASTVVIIQSSPSTGWRPPSSEVAALVNAWKHRYITWPASRYGRRLRSPGSPFVTPGGAITWRYPAPGWDTSISRSVSGGWNAMPPAS